MQDFIAFIGHEPEPGKLDKIPKPRLHKGKLLPERDGIQPQDFDFRILNGVNLYVYRLKFIKGWVSSSSGQKFHQKYLPKGFLFAGHGVDFYFACLHIGKLTAFL